MSKGNTAGSSNVDVTPWRAGEDKAAPTGRPAPASRRPGIDALLDDALEATFPASDPIAIEVDR